LSAGQSQTVFAGTGILQESGEIQRKSRVIGWKYRNSCPAGIPARNSCKSGWKQEFSRPLQNHVLVNEFLWKKMEKKKSSGILCFSVFQFKE
jgi:hypothetical protein